MSGLDYDLIIIGAGMIGSAAARHASARSGVKVCLIGPDEPETRLLDDGRDIYGAHYDEGRITRAISTSLIWTKLAIQSIHRYRVRWKYYIFPASVRFCPLNVRTINKDQGVQFYSEVGCLMAGSETFFKNVDNVVQKENIKTTSVTSQELKTTFPYLKFSNQCQGIYEKNNAGYISPRKLIKAQKIVATKQGCVIINDVVRLVKRKMERGQYVMYVETENNVKLHCKSVLVATGAFTSFRDLLPRPLDVHLTPIAVAKVEVSKAVADSLKSMPSVLYVGQGHKDWYKDKNFLNKNHYGFYLLPPVLYPDGRYYVKLGMNHEFTGNLRVNTAEEAKRWFVKGDPDIAEATKRLVVSIFEDVRIESWHGDYCIVVETPTTLPYIDKVHPILGVAQGGNGYAAKSSDEIGRLAADMMFGDWSSDIPRDVFRARYKNDVNSKL